MDVLGIDFQKECIKKFGDEYEDVSLGKKFELLNELILNFKKIMILLNHGIMFFS